MLRSIVLVWVALALAACGGPEEEPAGEPRMGSVGVINETPRALASLFVSPQSEAGWGSDLLDAPLPSGGRLELRFVPEGRCDLMAVAPGGERSHAWGFFVTAGELTWVTVR